MPIDLCGFIFVQQPSLEVGKSKSSSVDACSRHVVALVCPLGWCGRFLSSFLCGGIL